MKCEYCDNEVPMDATRCPSCGARVSHSGPIVVVQPQAGVTQSHTAIAIGDAPSPVHLGRSTQVLRLKSKSVFVLLGIFLGEFGIHNFYLGYFGRGITKLLITVLSLGWFCWISWIWGIVEVCIVRIDAKGVPLE